jgi:hypothetical protein
VTSFVLFIGLLAQDGGQGDSAKELAVLQRFLKKFSKAPEAEQVKQRLKALGQ